ncbi:MAG TPA: radical SAM protein [Candidatus Paceibacterota bacterium]|nr:radical SAM protein [Candidatus Paceibacterota bacterium]
MKKTNKCKILFINPPQTADKSVRQIGLKFPLGFLYMAGILEKSNFQVKILDCPLYYTKKRDINETKVKIGLFPEDIINEIEDFNPDIIGVSCAYTAFEQDSFEVISLIRFIEKNLNKKFLVVVGGAHSSANPEFVLRNKEIDLVVIGEGELTFLEISKRYSSNKKIDSIKGTALIKNGKFKKNKPQDYIKDLDSLNPAWHLINIKDYFDHPDNSRATMRKNSVDLITSRGCPGNCVFCSIHTVWGRCWRGRTAKNVVDEIEMLVKNYGAKQFRFQDDNLTLNKKRIIDICEEIIKRNIDIRWDTPNGIAIWTLDSEVLMKMKQAGCYRITFGVESGSLESQKYVRKIIPEEKLKELIEDCHKLGMWVCATFIIGFPFETEKDIEKTKDLIINSKINFPFVYIAQPYLGTDMYRDFQNAGLLNEIEMTSYIENTKYNTLNFKKEELNNIRKDIFKEFYKRRLISYINPITFYKEFLSKINNLEELKYIVKNLNMAIKGI